MDLTLSSYQTKLGFQILYLRDSIKKTNDSDSMQLRRSLYQSKLGFQILHLQSLYQEN